MQTEQRANQEKERLANQNNLSNKLKAQKSASIQGQNEIDINGIKILFPFQPYDCQLVYMQKVIETLEKVSNYSSIYFIFSIKQTNINTNREHTHY